MKKLNFLAIAFCLASFSPTYGAPAEKTIWQEAEERAALDGRPVIYHVMKIITKAEEWAALHDYQWAALDGRQKIITKAEEWAALHDCHIMKKIIVLEETGIRDRIIPTL